MWSSSLAAALLTSCARAAARHSSEPTGKSDGLGPECVADNEFVCLGLSITCGLLTMSVRRDHVLRKPGWKCALARIGFEFIFGHPLKHFIQIQALGSFNPLACSVYFRVGLHCCNDG